MYQKSTALFLYNLSPLHAGAGEGVGGIDLPIQREGHTGFPKIEASGIKGALKESFKCNSAEIPVNGHRLTVNEPIEQGENTGYKHISLVFGPEEGDLHSSAIAFSDARLLLLPIPSLRGTFAWVTCPLVLEQFIWDLQRIYPDRQYDWANGTELFNKILDDQAVVSEGSSLLLSTGQIMLQEYPFSAEPADLLLESQDAGEKQSESLGAWLARMGIVQNDFFADKLQKDIAIISNDNFRDFAELYTEVITRIRIDPKTGTVAQGALFTEEYLPAQSVLYSMVSFAPVMLPDNVQSQSPIKSADEVAEFYRLGQAAYWQLGANATLGKGLTHLKVLNT